MKKINKNIKIAVIYLLISVFLWPNCTYSSELHYLLRVAVGIDKDRQQQALELVQAFNVNFKLALAAIDRGWRVLDLLRLKELNQAFNDWFEGQFNFSARPEIVFISHAGYNPIGTQNCPSKSVICIDISGISPEEVAKNINVWLVEENIHALQGKLIGKQFATFPDSTPDECRKLFIAFQKGFSAPDQRFVMPPFKAEPFLRDGMNIHVIQQLFEIHAVALGWMLSAKWPVQKSPDSFNGEIEFWQTTIKTMEGMLKSFQSWGEGYYDAPFLFSQIAIFEVLLELNKEHSFLPADLSRRAQKIVRKLKWKTIKFLITSQFDKRFSNLKNVYKDYFYSCLGPARGNTALWWREFEYPGQLMHNL